jgi:hypothetical protein
MNKKQTGRPIYWICPFVFYLYSFIGIQLPVWGVYGHFVFYEIIIFLQLATNSAANA